MYAEDLRSARDWVTMAMLQLDRLRRDRDTVLELRIGNSLETLGPFVALRGDQHFLVLSLDWLRHRLERLGLDDLAQILPGWQALRDARNAFEHPDGPAPARFAEAHGTDHRLHRWSSDGAGLIAGVIEEAGLDDALLSIRDALWSDVMDQRLLDDT